MLEFRNAGLFIEEAVFFNQFLPYVGLIHISFLREYVYNVRDPGLFDGCFL